MTLSTTTEKKRIIDLSECLPDITSNIIHDSEHYQIPSENFENVILQAINDLLDDFALNPGTYLKSEHIAKIDTIAHQYLNS